MTTLTFAADDPRHGTPGGYLAHHRARDKACEPCMTARRRAHKAGNLRRSRGIYGRIPISPEAWRILNQIAPLELSLASGLSRGSLTRLRHRGPGAVILRTSNEAILRGAVRAVTPVGLQRRLRAISIMGWSMREVAARYPGANADALKELRRATVRQFVGQPVTKQILAAYRDLSMICAPASVSASQTRTLAAKRGYLSALAWDDETIDRPESRPNLDVSENDELDEQAIYRRIHGDRLKLTAAEQAEVVKRCLGDHWTHNQIEERTGLNAARVLGNAVENPVDNRIEAA